MMNNRWFKLGALSLAVIVVVVIAQLLFQNFSPPATPFAQGPSIAQGMGMMGNQNGMGMMGTGKGMAQGMIGGNFVGGKTTGSSVGTLLNGIFSLLITLGFIAFITGLIGLGVSFFKSRTRADVTRDKDTSTATTTAATKETEFVTVSEATVS